MHVWIFEFSATFVGPQILTNYRLSVVTWMMVPGQRLVVESQLWLRAVERLSGVEVALCPPPGKSSQEAS